MSLDMVPTWLREDMQGVEALLLETAGSSVHPLVGEASTHLIRAGGKRVRPALVLLSARAGSFGGRAIDLSAAAIELVHLATLYHDDVMDHTETRRGVPTVHTRWGIEVAVLAGDYLFARGCALGAQAGGEVPGILARAIGQVCEGQITETEVVGDPNRTVDHYMDTITSKTAALFRAACELGSATSDASTRDRAALLEFGEAAGVAFQIVDDVLDIVGDPEVVGKEPGTDVKDGVFTLPVILACDREPSLVALLMDGRRELDAVLPTLISTGALDDSYEAAEASCRRALDALGRLPSGEWRDALESIAQGILAQIPERTP